MDLSLNKAVSVGIWVAVGYFLPTTLLALKITVQLGLFWYLAAFVIVLAIFQSAIVTFIERLTGNEDKQEAKPAEPSGVPLPYKVLSVAVGLAALALQVTIWGR